MHRTLVLILCCIWLSGCVSHHRPAQQATYLELKPPSTATPPNNDSPVLEPLTDNEENALRDLVQAACDLADFGNPLPDRVLRRWEPIDLYYDRANVVIVLHRDPHEERGYYIVPPISSYLPAGHDRGWSWERLKVSGIYLQSVYTYRRTR